MKNETYIPPNYCKEVSRNDATLPKDIN